jgi:hypothetical protein
MGTGHGGLLGRTEFIPFYPSVHKPGKEKAASYTGGLFTSQVYLI